MHMKLKKKTYVLLIGMVSLTVMLVGFDTNTNKANEVESLRNIVETQSKSIEELENENKALQEKLAEVVEDVNGIEKDVSDIKN